MHLLVFNVLLIFPFAVSGLQIPLREPPVQDDAIKQGNPLDDRFADYIEGLLDRFKVPSLAIAVVDGDQTYSAAYGTAIFPDTPATPETLYYAGSTTKSFVAASFTILRDWTARSAKPLRLIDPLHKYIDNFRLASDYATLHTTLEDALSHRSGMPRHDLAYGGTNYTFENLIEALPYLPLTEEPRTTFQYCNIMFMLLSSVLEKVAHMSVGTFLRRYIWQPFGMDSTYFSLAEAQAAERNEGKQLARGYFWNSKSERFESEPWLDSVIISGAGNTISSVVDYAKYLSAMLNDQSPISEMGYRDLREPRTFIESTPIDSFGGPTMYTLGWQFSVYQGHEIYYHDGGLPGFGASMLYMPSKKWAITMLANTELRSNLLQEIVQLRLLDEVLEVPLEERRDLAPQMELLLQLLEAEYLNSTARLYPDRPKQPIQLSLPLEDYAGHYWHPGYQGFTLYLSKSHYPFAKKGMALTANRTGEITWQSELQFEHVSGVHFVVWSMYLPERPASMYQVAGKGEFRIAANGQVEAVGIAVEQLMGEEKIWFERIR